MTLAAAGVSRPHAAGMIRARLASVVCRSSSPPGCGDGSGPSRPVIQVMLLARGVGCVGQHGHGLETAPGAG